MKTALLFLAFSLASLAQTNPACPGATGTTPHCVVLTWTAPTTGSTPTSYNAYRSTATGVCTWTAAATVTLPTGCTQIGSVAAPTVTLTDNSSASNVLTEGATYFYVLASADASGVSAPSVEASAKIPVLLPGTPTAPTATAH